MTELQKYKTNITPKHRLEIKCMLRFVEGYRNCWVFKTAEPSLPSHRNLCSVPINPFKPVVSNGYTSKCSAPYWSNPPF